MRRLAFIVPIVLFLTPPITTWAQLLFPAWVLVLSVYILIAAPRDHLQD